MLKQLRALSLGAKLLLMSAFMLLVVVSCYLAFYVTDNGGGVSSIKLSNLTSNSVTVTWVTSSPTISKVYLSNTDSWPVLTERIGKQSFYDDRDTEQNHEGKFVLKDDAPKEYVTHSVTLRDLEPQTQYYFKVGGGVKLFGGEDDSFKTTAVTDSVTVPDPVYGKIAGLNGKEPTDGIVSYHIFVLDGEHEVASGVLSTTISKDSTWSGDLGLPYLQFSLLKKDVPISTASLWVEVVTELGKAVYKFPLDSYKPLPDIFLHQGTEEGSNQSPSTGVLPFIGLVSAAKSRCEETYNETCSNGGVKSCHKIGESEGGVPGPSCTWGPQSQCGQCSAPNSPNPTPAPAQNSSCLAGGCEPGLQYWIGSSGYCRTCANGCTVAVPNTSIPQCCNLLSSGDSRRSQNGCPGAPAPTQAPQEPGATPVGTPVPGPGSFPCGNYTNGQHWIGASTQNCNVCENGSGHVAANQSLCCDNSDALSSALKARYGCPAGTGNGTGNNGGQPTVTPAPGPWQATGNTCSNLCQPTMPQNSCPGSRLVGGGGGGATQEFCYYKLGNDQYTLSYTKKTVNSQCTVTEDTGNQASISACRAKSATGSVPEKGTAGGTTDVGVSVIPAAQCQEGQALCLPVADCANLRQNGPAYNASSNTFSCFYQIGNATSTVVWGFNDGCTTYHKVSESGTGLEALKLLCGPVGGQTDGGTTTAILGTATSAQTVSAGIYTVSGTGIVQSTVLIANDNTTVKFFNDLNSDGIKQDSEAYIDTASFEVKLNKTTDISPFTLINGWNLIALDSVSTDYSTAFKLISQINQQGGTATHAAVYANGSWEIFSVRLDDAGTLQKYGNDFNLVPGEGIFIKTSSASAFNLTGQKFADSVPVNLSNGWNLVSVQSGSKYTAASFLSKCTAAQLKCDTVSRYESARYESLVNSNGTNFGNDFNLIGRSGYFVRMSEGSGQLKP